MKYLNLLFSLLFVATPGCQSNFVKKSLVENKPITVPKSHLYPHHQDEQYSSGTVFFWKENLTAENVVQVKSTVDELSQIETELLTETQKLQTIDRALADQQKAKVDLTTQKNELISKKGPALQAEKQAKKELDDCNQKAVDQSEACTDPLAKWQTAQKDRIALNDSITNIKQQITAIEEQINSTRKPQVDKIADLDTQHADRVNLLNNTDQPETSLVDDFTLISLIYQANGTIDLTCTDLNCFTQQKKDCEVDDIKCVKGGEFSFSSTNATIQKTIYANFNGVLEFDLISPNTKDLFHFKMSTIESKDPAHLRNTMQGDVTWTSAATQQVRKGIVKLARSAAD